MFGNDNRNNLETWEDFDATPAGKALLNMPDLWEAGAYPRKKQESVPDNPLTQPSVYTAAYRDMPGPFAPVNPAVMPNDNDRLPAFSPDSADPLKKLADAFGKAQQKSALRRAQIEEKTKQDALTAPPVKIPEKAPSHTETAIPAPAASQAPYEAAGQLMKPASDIAIKKAIEPAIMKLGASVRARQPAGAAENDLIDMAGTITKAAGSAYTKDHYTMAANAIHQGETQGAETAYSHPGPKAENIMEALHEADSHGMEKTMINPDPDTYKGFENNLREINLSLQEVRLMGNRLIDPESGYLDSKELQQWIDRENACLKNSRVTKLVDFTRLDWRRNPDKFIELGGKYFRESLLGTHLFGYGVEVIKGAGGAGVNQIFGTVAGMAKFYSQSDHLMASILAGGGISSADRGWDMMVDRLCGHLPVLSRQALRFANSVMVKEVKAQMFEMMRDNFLQGRKTDKLYAPGIRSTVSGKGLNGNGHSGSSVHGIHELEMPPGRWR